MTSVKKREFDEKNDEEEHFFLFRGKERSKEKPLW